jgi:hypothetical protein
MKAKIGVITLFPAVLAIAGCQGGSVSNVLNPTPAPNPQVANAEPLITQDELEGYCPQITLRENTGYFSTYTRGNDGNPDELVYQAAITEVTRSCKQSNGQITINVAAAGRVVPGPRGSAGTIDMPIRVAVIDSNGVAYSQLTKYPVQIDAGNAATQFIFTDPNVTVPIVAGNRMQVLVGYDEGPPKKNGS